MKRKTIIFTILFVIAIYPLIAVAGGEKEKGTPPDLFASNRLLELTLTCDIKAVQKDIGDKPSYHDAMLTYRTASDREFAIPVKVKTRGNFRRNPKVCDWPPIMIKFSESTTLNTLFHRQKKMKLVTHCKKNIKTFNDYVIQEYLIYRIYNILTEKSFQARLVQVTYKDNKGDVKPITRFGVLIENENHLAHRLKGKIVKNKWGYHILTKINLKDRLIHAVFQFMIGHTDWSVPGEHNLKLVEIPSEKLIFPVPYDFDLTGFVNAHYARPDPKLADQISSVRQRLYRGFYVPEEKLEPVFAHFKEKKAEIYALLEEFQHIKKKRKKSCLDYLDRFYDIIDDHRKIEKHFIENSRNQKRLP